MNESQVLHAADIRRGRALWLLREAGLTFMAVLLAFAAYDDITTDADVDFTVEYFALLACGVWLLFMAVRLVRNGHRALGVTSLIALLAATWGQRGIGPGGTPGYWPHYVVTLCAFVWFTALSIVLLTLGWRAHPERSGPTV